MFSPLLDKYKFFLSGARGFHIGQRTLSCFFFFLPFSSHTKSQCGQFKFAISRLFCVQATNAAVPFSLFPHPEEITFSPDMRAARAFDKSHSDNVSVKLFGLA